jgi:thiol-disulfide isomerase/thioredoxin
MKNICLISMLFIFIDIAHSQIPENVIAIEDPAFNQYYYNKENIPKVHGKIINLNDKEIRDLKIDYTLVTPFEPFQKKKHCSLNSDGTFDLELDHAFPYQQIWLSVGDLVYTGLFANKNLQIKIDASIINSTQNRTEFIGPGLQFGGEDGPLNVYANSHTLFKYIEQNEIGKQIQRLLAYEPLESPLVMKKFDSLYAELFALDQEFVKENPSDFSWVIFNQRQSDYLGELCVKHWNKAMPNELLEKVKKHKSYTISNEGMLFYTYYFTYVNELVKRNRTLNKMPDDVELETLQTIQMLDSLHLPSKSDFLKMKFSSIDLKEKNIMLQTALSRISTNWCRDALMKEQVVTKEKLGNIQNILNESTILTDPQLGVPVMEMPFGAKLYKVDTGSAKDLLSNLRSYFKDKAIYIDFWATWCAPCIAEFPYSIKLKEATREHPIEFVYLCTSNSSSLEKWKSSIAEYKLSGTHIFVEQSIENELMDNFSLSSFPSYLFIDKNGNNKQGYLRPSILDAESFIKLIGNTP